jgi:CheY-like chemotaxis protein
MSEYSTDFCAILKVVSIHLINRGKNLMSILIVEDNAVNAMLLEHFLKKGGYQTRVVNNALVALTTLSSIHDVQLIITDLQMPEMNGLEFIAKLKGSAVLKGLPIIVVSAQSDVGTVSRAGGLACDAFLVKPIEKEQLLKKVEQLINNEPPVMWDKQCIMNNLGIEAREYDNLLIAFNAQLVTAMPIVASEHVESDETISENLHRLLKELAESADILGAERFVRSYAKLKGANSVTRSRYDAVLKALQELKSALRTDSTAAPQLDAPC